MSERYWITKYALSKGIDVVAGPQADLNPNFPKLLMTGRGRASCYGEGLEWHRSRASAIARAEEMRKAKIASLKKQIAKLEKLSFESAPE